MFFRPYNEKTIMFDDNKLLLNNIHEYISYMFYFELQSYILFQLHIELFQFLDLNFVFYNLFITTSSINI